MNVPADLAKQVVESMKATPFVLSLLIINIIVLVGFTYTLHEVSDAAERADKMLEKCIK